MLIKRLSILLLGVLFFTGVSAQTARVMSKPSQTTIEKAVILDVKLKLDYTAVPNVKTPEDFRNILRSGGTGPWAEVPGLRSKYFTITEDGQAGGGIYTFFNRQALDDYLASDLFQAMFSFPHLTDLSYTIYEVMGGSELTVDLGDWE